MWTFLLFQVVITDVDDDSDSTPTLAVDQVVSDSEEALLVADD